MGAKGDGIFHLASCSEQAKQDISEAQTVEMGETTRRSRSRGDEMR